MSELEFAIDHWRANHRGGYGKLTGTHLLSVNPDRQGKWVWAYTGLDGRHRSPETFATARAAMDDVVRVVADLGLPL